MAGRQPIEVGSDDETNDHTGRQQRRGHHPIATPASRSLFDVRLVHGIVIPSSCTCPRLLNVTGVDAHDRVEELDRLCLGALE